MTMEIWGFFHPTSPHHAIPLMAFTAEAHDIQRFGLVVRRQLAVIGTEDRESVVAAYITYIHSSNPGGGGSSRARFSFLVWCIHTSASG